MRSTISENYLEQQVQLHHNPAYGTASLQFVPLVAQIIKSANVKSIADYGAGKMNLYKGLTEGGMSGFEYYPFDPVFPEYGSPREADLVCCIDVLEHIEPTRLENVLVELSSITKNYGFFSIHMGPAAKILPDGRNAHLIQKPSGWWLLQLCKYFDVVQLQMYDPKLPAMWLIVKRSFT
jgi:hypothetical protein